MDKKKIVVQVTKTRIKKGVPQALVVYSTDQSERGRWKPESELDCIDLIEQCKKRKEEEKKAKRQAKKEERISSQAKQAETPQKKRPKKEVATPKKEVATPKKRQKKEDTTPKKQPLKEETTDPKQQTRRVARKIEEILGVKKGDEELLFCVKFKGSGQYEVISNSEMRERHPVSLLNFYQEKIVLYDE